MIYNTVHHESGSAQSSVSAHHVDTDRAQMPGHCGELQFSWPLNEEPQWKGQWRRNGCGSLDIVLPLSSSLSRRISLGIKCPVCNSLSCVLHIMFYLTSLFYWVFFQWRRGIYQIKNNNTRHYLTIHVYKNVKIHIQKCLVSKCKYQRYHKSNQQCL